MYVVADHFRSTVFLSALRETHLLQAVPLRPPISPAHPPVSSPAAAPAKSESHSAPANEKSTPAPRYLRYFLSFPAGTTEIYNLPPTSAGLSIYHTETHYNFANQTAKMPPLAPTASPPTVLLYLRSPPPALAFQIPDISSYFQSRQFLLAANSSTPLYFRHHVPADAQTLVQNP